jgi:hypothetical protein
LPTACSKSSLYTLTNPQDSLELIQREVPEMALNPGSKEFARIGLGMWQHGIDRPEVHEHGLGWSDPAAYVETTNLVLRYPMEAGAKRPDPRPSSPTASRARSSSARPSGTMSPPNSTSI